MTDATLIPQESAPPAPEPVRTRRFALSRAEILVAVLLFFVVALGGYFRFTGTNWDDYVHFHPDERFMVSFVGANLGRSFLSFTDGNEAEQEAYCREQYPNSNGVGGFFDARCSNWNPHNIGNGHYAYGTLPPFTARVVAEVMNQIDNSPQNVDPASGFRYNHWTSGDGLTLLWRTLSALYDTITILVVFFIGYTLRGKWTGLVAAALYAGAVLPIQIAHFATSDGMATMWVALTLLFSLRAQQHGGWLNWGFVGLAFGAALASRFNIFPLVLVIMAASGIRLLPVLDGRLSAEERTRLFVVNFGGLVLAGAMTLLAFRLFNPYAFTGPGFFGLLPNSRWLEDLSQARFETSNQYDGPPHWQWTGRPPYLFAFSNMVLWGMGIALGLMGWFGWGWSLWRIVRGRAGALAGAGLVLWILVYFGWVGGNFVMSMRYYLPLYPAFAALAAWALIEIVTRAYARNRARNGGRSPGMPLRVLRRAAAMTLLAVVVGFTLLWAGMFTNIYRHQATFVQASHWVWENVPGDFAMRIDGASDAVPLINIAYSNPPTTREQMNDALAKASRFDLNSPRVERFVAPTNGTVSSIQAPSIGSPAPSNEPSTLRLAIANENGETLVETTITDTFPYSPNRVGQPYIIGLPEPIQVRAGHSYTFTAELVRGAPIVTGGSLLAWEGSWDEVMPADICRLPYNVWLADDPPPGLIASRDCERRAAWSGLISGFQLELYAEDNEFKRDELIRILDNTEYIMIGTNRRYDSQRRIPHRWPLTNRYYEALFSGELGYELVAMFQESYELGPLRVSDQHLPIYDSPAWLNEFEAEEAFHVYDHPVVFVYRRGPDYSPERTRDILYSVPLNTPDNSAGLRNPRLVNRFYWSTGEASDAPTQLQFTPDMQQVQTQGGTWSERFDRDSLVNAQPFVGMALWWLMMVGIGWAVWPLLFAAFPGLADRGYAFAKFVGIFLIGWLAWVAATARLPLWSGPGLWLITGLVALVSLLIVVRMRARLLAYIRGHWRLLLGIEAISLLLFLAMVGVRLTNPDLWTVGYGGEKPMDFAYFNGVLRSTIFPPVDPWFAGGYINYYYFGFVIVGVPTLMLGVVPSIAYNLIVPLIYAATGIGAFSIAYNIVAALRTRNGHSEPAGPVESEDRRERYRPRRTLGNPWVAGFAALILAVVAGNLDTPREFLKGVADLGGPDPIPNLQAYLVDQYIAENGVPPSDTEMGELLERARESRATDRVPYELSVAGTHISNIVSGFGRLMAGEQPYINANRWFWGPSRVVGEGIGGGDPSITEMPYFTFVYGDLHAHMISMPLMFFAVAFVFNELMLAGREQRRLSARALAVFFGALTTGMFFAINSWEWPTFTLFGVLGLGYAWWLSYRRISRRSLWGMLVLIGGFLVLNFLVALPYREWYASLYSSFQLWQGEKTPLWAYFQVHGLFLFLVASLLVWETSRWLRTARVRGLEGQAIPLVLGILMALGVIVVSVFAATRGYQAALVALPMVAWIAVLFFRPGQTIPMQFTLVVAGLALCITLGVEAIVLENDNGRMNTIFKFYIQVWLLFSAACGAAAAWLLRASDDWGGLTRGLWYVVGSVLLFAALLFPIMSTVGKAQFRLASNVPLTLDGNLYLSYDPGYSAESYAPDRVFLPVDMGADYEIIHWLQENVEGSPAIIEGHGRGEYNWGGRISINTGLPAVLGWNWHQRQQRTFEPFDQLVWYRVANINEFYMTEDPIAAWNIIDFYDVEYVIVGGMERALYFDSGLEKFDEMVERGWLEVVFETPMEPQEVSYRDPVTQSPVIAPYTPFNARIYRVNPDANPLSTVAEVQFGG